MSYAPRCVRWSPALRIVLVLALGGVGLAAAGSGSDAQEPRTPEIRLTVAELTGVLGPGTVGPPEAEDLVPGEEPEPEVDLQLRALIENRGSAEVDALRLVVEVYPASPSRPALREALAGDPGAPPLLVDDLTLREDALGAGEIAGSNRRYTPERIAWAAEGGVHPVRIAVVRGTEVLDTHMTAVVWLEEYPSQPINTVLVWPLDGPPWRGVGGAYTPDADAPIRPGARVERLVRVLEQAAAPPVVLAPSPHLLEDLRDRADGFDLIVEGDDGEEVRRVDPEAAEARRANDLLQRIRQLAGSLPSPPIVGTYADADLSWLHDTGDRLTRELASDAAATARFRLQVELGRPPLGSVHLLSQPVSDPVLDLLPGDQLLMPYTATAEARQPGNPQPGNPLRPLRSPAGRALTVAVADPYLADLLTDPDEGHGPVLPAQQLVAETAMVHLDPPTSGPGSLLLLPDPGWDPSIGFATEALARLRTAPWLHLTDTPTLMTDGRRDTTQLELRQPDQGPGTGFASELTAAVGELAAAQAMLPEATSRIGGRTPAELEDALIRATSRWLHVEDGPSGAAEDLVQDVRTDLSELFGEITISETSVTLTSETGQVPVTLQRTAGEAIAVQVEVASRGQLIWPEGRRSEVLLIDEGTSTTVAFPTEALGTGTFPVTVRVTDPTGRHELARTTLNLRSTAISRPALAGIGAVVVVLLLFGSLRRRKPSPRLTVVTHDGGRPEAADPSYSPERPRWR